MVAALAITPASGSIEAVRDACRVDVSGAETNDVSAFDAEAYPTAPEMRYYLTFEKGGNELGRSYVFGVNGGAHQFNNYIFPEAGSWTVRLNDAADDSSVATLAVTVA